jgi:hypothetical protein
MGDPPVAPQHDPPDDEDFGTTEGVGDGYPEEAQREAVPPGSDPDRRFKQEGEDRKEG